MHDHRVCEFNAFRFEDLGLCNGRILEEHHFLRKPMAVLDKNRRETQVSYRITFKMVNYAYLNMMTCWMEEKNVRN